MTTTNPDIGDRREIINPLNADHRSICKFDSPSDPNYVFIRNSLVKATEDILAKGMSSSPWLFLVLYFTPCETGI